MKKISHILLLFLALNIVECFARTNFRERIYLQTDKHLYLAGEPVLIKLVTTDTELIPTTFSRIGYVELVRDSIAALQIMVKLKNGVGTGQMILPADLPTGYYRLIAYTQFMRNEDYPVFFERNIAVLNTFLMDYEPSEVRNRPISQNIKNFSTGVSVQPNQAIYATRERGEVILDGLPENIRTLSITIAGRDWIPATESNMALFERTQTKESTKFSGQFLPEYEGHIITGKLVRNEIEELTNETLLPCISFPGEGTSFFPGQITENGDVRFVTSGGLGTTEVATIVYFSDENYRVDILSPFITRFSPREMPILHIDTTYYEQLLQRSVALQLFRFFSENSSENVFEPFLKTSPSETYLLREFTRFTTMREIFTEFILGARFRRRDGDWRMSVLTRNRSGSFEHGTQPLVLLDGVPISSHNMIFNYDPLLVERIDIYYGPFAFGGHLFDGVIKFTTYRRQHEGLNFTGSSQLLSYTGPQTPFLFQTIDHSNEEQRRSRVPDGRHTLLWNPNITSNGKPSVRLPFNTSDLTGEFQITVEGITKDGAFIHATSSFKVSE